MKKWVVIWSLLVLIVACSGEDRSGEIPYAPTVETLEPQLSLYTCTFLGKVTASPNSSLTKCGFIYGNDSIKATINSKEADYTFSAEVDSLESGVEFYVVAFATNRIGTSYGDTLSFCTPDVEE